MEDKELLDAMRQMIREETARIIKDETTQILKVELESAKKELLDGVNVLMDTHFQTQFNLLAERQDDILRKMPSEDDMDIIDGTLQKHTVELRVHRKEIDQLKKAL